MFTISAMLVEFFFDLLEEGLCKAEVAYYGANNGALKMMTNEDVENVSFEINIVGIESGTYDGAVDGVGMPIGEGWMSDGFINIEVESAQYTD